MRKLAYSTSLSLDGYIDSAAGDPSWAVPDEELHKYFNDIERETNILLYIRRMYELMKPVETHTFSSGTVLLKCAPVTPS